MKVLHITKSVKGGAGIAAKRLHEALCEHGVQSAFLSCNLVIDFNNQIVKAPFFTYKKPSLFKKIYLKMKAVFFPGQYHLVVSSLQKLKEKLDYEIVTLPFSSYKLHEHPLVKEADVINLHWIGEFVDFPTFFKNCTKPIVWTLHDMNPFLGIFHYRNDEVRNKLIVGHLDGEMKQLKKKQIQSVDNGIIVSPSKWLFEEATKSAVFHNWDAKEIPNSINFELFNQQDKAFLRSKLKIGSNEFVLLFIVDSLNNSRKGFDILAKALLILKDIELTVLVVGTGEIPSIDIDNVKIISLGEVRSTLEMAEYYGLADVFVLPSREDNLPNVMLEAFACGLPLIGFNTGGIAEHTIENITGILADEMTAESLENAIVKFYETRNNYNRGLIRKYAEDNFSPEKQVSDYLEVYKSIFSR